MAFGQQSGPPATARQVQELLALVLQAGHTDFRDARGPLGLTQRQAAGKFTRDEADAFIEALTEAQDTADVLTELDGGPPPRPRSARVTAADQRKAEQVRALQAMAPELLAAELQRRGWAVMAP
ncbi:hypothetical protein [Iamia sp.]|uniref:hypothetical protein n=1 Tax=Iamia sp. TaxID=2722710 RepID=UPI002B78B868|nr:hypothetical protein [Iamia sp.]HXH59095.1 hypothetical protein [Iamia sp.]